HKRRDLKLSKCECARYTPMKIVLVHRRIGYQSSPLPCCTTDPCPLAKTQAIPQYQALAKMQGIVPYDDLLDIPIHIPDGQVARIEIKSQVLFFPKERFARIFFHIQSQADFVVVIQPVANGKTVGIA